jgi:hypothetical protein
MWKECLIIQVQTLIDFSPNKSKDMDISISLVVLVNVGIEPVKILNGNQCNYEFKYIRTNRNIIVADYFIGQCS